MCYGGYKNKLKKRHNATNNEGNLGNLIISVFLWQVDRELMEDGRNIDVVSTV